MRVPFLFVALAACGGSVPETGSRTASYPGPYSLVTAATADGRIEILSGELTGVELEFLPNGSDTWVETEDAGTLSLVAACLGETEPGCGGGLVLTVPIAQDLVADTVHGEIALGAGLSGTLDAQTASGAVRATDLTAADLTVLTGTGPVDATFAVAPRAVSIDSGSSAITLVVPAGGYALDVDTNGEATVDPAVTDDPSGPPLRVHSGTGAITVSAR